MSPSTKPMMQEELFNEVSHINRAPCVSCYASSGSELGWGMPFKILSIFLSRTGTTCRFYHPARDTRKILAAGLIGVSSTLSGIAAIIVAVFCFAISGSLTAAPTLHEQLLASDPGLREADAVHSAAYRLLRGSLDKDNQQQLKAAQIRWIDSLNQTLAQTPPSQRSQVVLQWTQERTRSLNGIYELRNGKAQIAAQPEVQQPATQNQGIPQYVTPPKWPSQSEQAETATTTLSTHLCTDIANHWKSANDDTVELPDCLPNALVDRLEQLVPWSKIDQAAAAKGRYPNLKLAYGVHHALIAKPLDLTSLADLLGQCKDLNLGEVPWVGSFPRILEKRRVKALSLQKDAMSLLKDGDAQAAESRLEQAVKEYPSASLSAYSAALMSYDKLIQDKALRAVDGDWKKPSLPNKELVGKSTEQAAILRGFDGEEVLPALSSLAKGLEAAGVLGKFSSDYEPAGDRDQPHPIRALQAMRRSEKYRELQADDSVFTKPFIDRMKFLDELIGPKTKDYEKLMEQGAGLEKEGKYLNAASTFRLALGIEYSKELEQTIHRCEAKTSGL